MINLPYEKKAHSNTTTHIGGLKVQLYNVQEVLEAAKQSKHEEFHLNVVYVLHPRGGDHHFSESIAYNILDRYYKQKKDSQSPMICVAWDGPNHGSRIIDETKNSSWNSGNDTHGVDMASIIDSWVEEIKLVQDYLGAELNIDYYLEPLSHQQREQREKDEQPRVVFHNLVTGYLLGGHTAIRFGSKYPSLVEVINPVVGCSDLTSLLLARLLGNVLDSDRKMFYFTYDELELEDSQRKLLYPRALHERLSRQDRNIFENFRGNGVKVYAAYGADDTLVAPAFLRSWIQMIELGDGISALMTQKDVGHTVTSEMLDGFVQWYVGIAQ